MECQTITKHLSVIRKRGRSEGGGKTQTKERKEGNNFAEKERIVKRLFVMKHDINPGFDAVAANNRRMNHADKRIVLVTTTCAHEDQKKKQKKRKVLPPPPPQ
jgi:hypothetical protein